jgi:hypothetical protein
MGREDWDGEGRLGWVGKIGMRREDWDREGRLGWGGKIGMGREDWDGKERLGWVGKMKWHSLRSLPFQCPKKVSIFRGPPLPIPLARNGYCPHQNTNVPRHMNNRYINSYYNCCPLYDVVVNFCTHGPLWPT